MKKPYTFPEAKEGERPIGTLVEQPSSEDYLNIGNGIVIRHNKLEKKGNIIPIIRNSRDTTDDYEFIEITTSSGKKIMEMDISIWKALPPETLVSLLNTIQKYFL